MNMTELFSYPSKIIKSRVWKVFKFRKNDNGDIQMDNAICSLCLKEYANKGIVKISLFILLLVLNICHTRTCVNSYVTTHIKNAS